MFGLAETQYIARLAGEGLDAERMIATMIGEFGETGAGELEDADRLTLGFGEIKDVEKTETGLCIHNRCPNSPEDEIWGDSFNDTWASLSWGRRPYSTSLMSASSPTIRTGYIRTPTLSLMIRGIGDGEHRGTTLTAGIRYGPTGEE